MANSVQESLEMIRDDAIIDAESKIEMTPLGLGTSRGHMLAQICALANNSLILLDGIEQLEKQRNE